MFRLGSAEGIFIVGQIEPMSGEHKHFPRIRLRIHIPAEHYLIPHTPEISVDKTHLLLTQLGAGNLKMGADKGHNPSRRQFHIRNQHASGLALAERLSQSSLQKNQEELLNCAENLRSVKNLIDQAINFTYFGQKTGGQRSTAKKIQAVRENGKKGGRPSKKILIKIEKNQSEETYSVWFNDGSIKVVPGKSLQDVRNAFPITRYKWSGELEEAYQKIYC